MAIDVHPIGASVRPPTLPVAAGRGTRRRAQHASRENRLVVVDLFRFAAAAMVFAYHLLFAEAESFWGADPVDLFGWVPTRIAAYGWMGVEFFFVISGFVVCMSSWGRSLGAFFVSRVSRLLPAYVCAVLLTSAVLTLWPAVQGRPGPLQVLANLTMVHGLLGVGSIDSPYWTLLVELKFYLIFALVVFRGVTYKRVVAFCLLWQTACLFATASDVRLLRQLCEPRFAPYFIAGVVLYLIHRFGPDLLLWGMLAASFVFGLVSLKDRVGVHHKAGNEMSFPVAAVIMAVLMLVMVGVALGWFSWVRWRALVTVGALTYPLYLLHMANGKVAVSVLRDDLAPWALVAVVFAAVVGLSYLVHRVVEKPLGLALRDRLRAALDRLHPPRPAAAPVPPPAVAVPPPGEMDDATVVLHLPFAGPAVPPPMEIRTVYRPSSADPPV